MKLLCQSESQLAIKYKPKMPRTTRAQVCDTNGSEIELIHCQVFLIFVSNQI